MLIIDGRNSVLGRLATQIAKELLGGEEINIINSEEIIITGNPKQIVEKYFAQRGKGSPQHGPFSPKKPDLIVRRTIRGMLPKNRRGRNALKKLRVYIGVPEELKEKEAKSIAVKEIKTNFILLRELSKSLGWKE